MLVVSIVVIGLVLFGLCLGSFVNALVWRLRQQELEQAKPKPNAKRLKKLSIVDGRSMCPQCKHELKAIDLVPVLSWLALRGRCRYCKAPIAAEYPLVELGTAVTFLASYIWWPSELTGIQYALFGLWLSALVGLVALLVYDLHWKLLPDRIMVPVAVVGVLYALIKVVEAADPWQALVQTILAVAIGGGIFYVLFQVSAGKWIGGGDVKLGWVLGLFVGTAGASLLFIFLAALIGSAVSLLLLASHRVDRKATIPFGPFLILGAIIVVLHGQAILNWYTINLLQL